MKTVESNGRERAVNRRLRRAAVTLATQASKATQSASSVEERAAAVVAACEAQLAAAQLSVTQTLAPVAPTLAQLNDVMVVIRQRIDTRLASLRDGDPGKPGKDAKGEVGPVPRHEWQGTKIRFEKPNNVWGKWVDLQGPAASKRSTPATFERPAPIVIQQTVVQGGDQVATAPMIRTVTGSTSIAPDDDIVIVNAATSATVTLPSAASRNRPLYIKRIGAGAVTVQGAELIDGDPMKLINTRYTALMLASSGAEWVVL